MLVKAGSTAVVKNLFFTLSLLAFGRWRHRSWQARNLAFESRKTTLAGANLKEAKANYSQNWVRARLFSILGHRRVVCISKGKRRNEVRARQPFCCWTDWELSERSLPSKSASVQRARTFYYCKLRRRGNTRNPWSPIVQSTWSPFWQVWNSKSQNYGRRMTEDTQVSQPIFGIFKIGQAVFQLLLLLYQTWQLLFSSWLPKYF